MSSPNADDGLVPDVTEEFKRDKGLWRKKAEELCRQQQQQQQQQQLLSKEKKRSIEDKVDETSTIKKTCL